MYFNVVEDIHKFWYKKYSELSNNRAYSFKGIFPTSTVFLPTQMKKKIPNQPIFKLIRELKVPLK